MLLLPDSWTWDFWIHKTESTYELFFLYASKALHDPDLRHRRAQIGRATSTDLHNWTRLPDALVRSNEPAHDDVATWTGSTITAPDGTYHTYYTGMSDNPVPETQRVLRAISTDLITWHKDPSFVVEADPRWYETAHVGLWDGEGWRDPWVFFNEETQLWNMLVTAHALTGEKMERGVVGMATSPDLDNWTVVPPITEPNGGFGQLEVNQVENVNGQWVNIFACLDAEIAERRQTIGGGGTWLAYGQGPNGPFDIDGAIQLTDSSGYAGRIVQDFDGQWQLLFFMNMRDGEFVGGLGDPVPLAQAMKRTVTGA